MKRFLKIAGSLIGVLVFVLLVFLWIQHEPLPETQPSVEADALARKMLKALNHDAYKNTRYLEWSYRGGKNQYKWDKQLGTVEVRLAAVFIDLNLKDPAASKVTIDGKKALKDDKEELIEEALKNFNNDSFWLVAPYKVFDTGTQRSLVDLEDGTKGLLVTYNSGGTTPGDSYLWVLNDNGFPDAYKMWVKIIPVGGLKASWDDWIIAESGAYLPKSHKLGPINLSMGNVKGYD